MSDDISGKFEFTYKEGKPFLRVLDPSIKRVVLPAQLLRPAPVPVQETQVAVEEPQPALRVSHKIGVVFSYNAHQYPYLQVDAVLGEVNEDATSFTGKVERADLARFLNA